MPLLAVRSRTREAGGDDDGLESRGGEKRDRAYVARLIFGSSCGSASLGFYKVRVDWTQPTGPSVPEVFADGFESGTQAGWTTSVP